MVLLKAKENAIAEVKAAQDKIYAELENQKAAAAEVENEIARKKTLLTKEEYITKCLQKLALEKRKLMPNGPVSYFFNATFGMKFLLKETFLASNYVKTHIRNERKTNPKKGVGGILTQAPGLDVCKTIFLTPKLLMSGLAQSLGLDFTATSSVTMINDTASPTKRAASNDTSPKPKWNIEP